MPRPPRTTFHGWYLVVGLGVTTIVSYGISQYLFGVLVVPIQHDLGWSRATISGYLVARLGWRGALPVLAATALLIALPIHALLVRRRPEDLGLLPDGEPPPEGHDLDQVGGQRLRAALHQPAFWTLMVATALSSAGYSVLLAHLIAYLIGR